jgi:hypothetical protein
MDALLGYARKGEEEDSPEFQLGILVYTHSHANLNQSFKNGVTCWGWGGACDKILYYSVTGFIN